MEVFFFDSRPQRQDRKEYRPMLLGAIDIGTNSCRLLIAEIEKNTIKPVIKTLKSTRIGQGVAGSGLLGAPAMDYTVAALAEFRKLMDLHRVAAYRAVATSAFREAGNACTFIHRIKRETEIEVEIISGEEEGRLSYLGVQKGLQPESPPLLIDLGGGSTEMILPGGRESGLVVLSLPLGAVKAQEEALTPEGIRQKLQSLQAYRAVADRFTLVFAGGTASSLVAIKLGLQEYRSHLIHGQILTREDIERLYRYLNNLPLEERSKVPGLQASRADIIPYGAMMIVCIMELLGQGQIMITESDILEGMIYDLAPDRPGGLNPE